MSSDLYASGIASLVAALADGSGAVRLKARAALVEIGNPAVPALIATLRSHDAQVRWEAAKALHDLADPSAAAALVAALEDKSFDVRWLAAEGLALIGRKALEPLFSALADHGDAVWLREGAHHMLKIAAHRGLAETVGPVLAALEGVEPELVTPPVAQAALKTLHGAA